MKTYKLFIIAGEPSGDVLGGKIMQALQAQSGGGLQFFGIGGDRMQEQGLTSIFPMKELSVMGFAEIIPHIPHLLKRIRQTAEEIKHIAPDMVLTIDAPEFCFRVAKKIQDTEITRVHCVAPSVWAYRPKRAAAIAGLYHHLLALLPFEPPYFEREGLATSFIGHPIVEDVKFATAEETENFRMRYGINKETPLLCMLPGSRQSEIIRLWPVFAEAVRLLQEKYRDLVVVIPAVSSLADSLNALARTLTARAIVIRDIARKPAAFAASNVALAKSGTGTLELAMAKLPMIVAYKVKPFSAWLARRLLKIRYVNLINLILNREVIPELLQEDCTPERLAKALDGLLSSPEKRQQQVIESAEALAQLGVGMQPVPSAKAAEVLLGLMQQK